MKLILSVCLLAFLVGCASYEIKDEQGRIVSSGSTSGIMRTITVVEEYNELGQCTKRSISTESNTKDVLMGLNEFIDTAIDTAGKIKP